MRRYRARHPLLRRFQLVRGERHLALRMQSTRVSGVVCEHLIEAFARHVQIARVTCLFGFVEPDRDSVGWRRRLA